MLFCPLQFFQYCLHYCLLASVLFSLVNATVFDLHLVASNGLFLGTSLSVQLFEKYEKVAGRKKGYFLSVLFSQTAYCKLAHSGESLLICPDQNHMSKFRGKASLYI